MIQKPLSFIELLEAAGCCWQVFWQLVLPAARTLPQKDPCYCCSQPVLIVSEHKYLILPSFLCYLLASCLTLPLIV
eukprot:2903148-Pleurochrysis_carterae.AAC.7